MLDSILLIYLPMFLTTMMLALLGVSPDVLGIVVNLISLSTVFILFFRDSIFGGAGPGKRIMGLRVVRSSDGSSPLGAGQGFLRWLSQLIPFFNLYDAIVPYRDPLFRRIGDRWAKTRVLDTPQKLQKVRDNVARQLIKKGTLPPRAVGSTMEDLARIV
jgi:uncharacterized RDD family membrane protein YckC